MTDPFTPHNLHLSPEPQPIARATSEASLAVLQSPALAAFIRERIEQVEKHGFAPEHDALHDECELARGAAAYITAGLHMELGEDPSKAFAEAIAIWPWGELFKPGDYETCLIKAIAMLWAEVDRVHNARQLLADVFPDGPPMDTIVPDKAGALTRHCGRCGEAVKLNPRKHRLGDGNVIPHCPKCFPVRRCRVCGCTETSACMTEEGPCAWAAADLCTSCVGKPDPKPKGE